LEGRWAASSTRVWFLHRGDVRSATCSMPLVLDLHGRLDTVTRQKGYRWRDISVRHLLETARFPCAWRLALTVGVDEVRRSPLANVSLPPKTRSTC
jgi:hypothetical protein